MPVVDIAASCRTASMGGRDPSQPRLEGCCSNLPPTWHTVPQHPGRPRIVLAAGERRLPIARTPLHAWPALIHGRDCISRVYWHAGCTWKATKQSCQGVCGALKKSVLQSERVILRDRRSHARAGLRTPQRASIKYKYKSHPSPSPTIV